MKKWLAGLLAALFVIAAVPAYASERAEEMQSVSFEDFYVSGGHVYTAYLSTLDRITMTSGRWLSADGRTSASLTGGMAFASYPNGWKFGEDGGVYWRQIHSEKTGFQAGWGIVLDPSLIPAGDFTVEIVAAYHGVEDDAGNRYYSGKSQYAYGIGGESFCVGNVRAYGWSALNNDSATDSLGHRWFFTPLIYTQHNTGFSGKVGVNMAEEHAFAMAGEDTPVNYTVKYDRAEDKQSFTLMQDIGFQNVKTSSVKLSQINGTGTLTQIPDTNDSSSVENTSHVGMYLKFLAGIPAHVYSVRVYDRVLTAAEQKQNHFADLAGYYGLNLFATLSMTEEEKTALFDVFSAYGYRGGDGVKAELQAFVDGAALSDYDALYDKTNMTVLLTAFRGGTTLDLQAGVWENTASGADARLAGPRWEKKNGGVGYSMTYAEWKADQSFGSNYIDLAANNPSDNYVVEILQTVEGITAPDGTRYTDTAGANGVYSGAYACYEIGYTKLTGFVSLSQTAGCSMTLRCSYLKSGYWSKDNGGYWLGGSAASLADVSQYLPVTLTLTGTKGTFSRSNSTLYKSTTATSAETSKTHKLSNVSGLDLSLAVNGAQKYAVNTVTTGTVAINPESFRLSIIYTRYEKFLQTTYATGGEFRLMRNLPGTVYSVKVYTSAPSEAQKAQNHFADLCGYYGLDVRGVEELSSEEMAELYAAFASHSILAVNADHTVEKAALQALISAKTAEILHGRLGHGDVDGDGEVTTADATLLLRYLADWQITLPHPDRADVDHDGAVTLRDAQKLLQYLAEFTGATL